MQDPLGIAECGPEARVTYFAQCLALRIQRYDSSITELQHYKEELDRACQAAFARRLHHQAA